LRACISERGPVDWRLKAQRPLHSEKNSMAKKRSCTHAKVKSWSEFEKGTSVWQIEERDGRYQVAPAEKSRYGRGWEEPLPKNIRLLPVDTRLEEAAEQNRLPPLCSLHWLVEVETLMKSFRTPATAPGVAVDGRECARAQKRPQTCPRPWLTLLRGFRKVVHAPRSARQNRP